MIQYKKIINATNAPLTPAMLQLALVKSGLKWKMNIAQLLSIEYNSYMNGLTDEVSQVTKNLELMRETAHTLYGLPIEVDNSQPVGWVILCLGEEHIFKIEALAVPNGFDEITT